MTLFVTLSLMGVTLLVLALTTLLSRREYVPGKPPLVPYGFVQFVAILVLLMLAGHVITLVTGTPFKGRF
ncbi:hypothetical protein JCM17844_09770 [Iodidimonas gelatinilytica]|uniref:Uncharacterized protein n=2 Tax=Iodidimonas TaxID=2066486 RepID=A0A5A7MMY7_9PROT|nr:MULTISPECIES: hypothetical protein [Iodidimonas]GEQ97340.1 hypothetical protein JCM17844_09770 [Iodidimonas gelatinilytica]GEQ99664.1 hypothetical protein JCM17845_02880 [Iodidimonas gelatinilytica]GER07231.1 hypothetical protein JCM17843_15410 [Kordiimonadales bacterium JCM 17843]GGO11414.1 hypothetical protein GCM10007972_15170 [Iodidimonas muriae]